MHKFGLSIKGGAARGLGAIGFIRFLQEEGLAPRVIAGSSSGAIVASMYALGFTWQQMIDFVNDIQLRKIINVAHVLKYGSIIAKSDLEKILSKYHADIRIEELPVKLILFASDIKTRQREFLDHGSLYNALHASCAFPFILPKANVNHKLLIDGDLTSAFSTSVLKSKGASKVLGVGYKVKSNRLGFGKGLDKAVDLYRYTTFEVERMNDEADPPDYEFRYPADKFSYFNFKNIDKLAEKSYNLAKEERSAILKVIAQ